MTNHENIYEVVVRAATEKYNLHHDIGRTFADCLMFTDAIRHANEAIHDNDTWRLIFEADGSCFCVVILNASTTEPSFHLNKVKDRELAKAWAHALVGTDETAKLGTPTDNGDQAAAQENTTGVSETAVNPGF